MRTAVIGTAPPVVLLLRLLFLGFSESQEDARMGFVGFGSVGGFPLRKNLRPHLADQGARLC